jgi:hypothetical protein
METNKIPVTELHAAISAWKSDIQLVRSEIATFRDQLGEIASKNSHEEVLKEVEHFQNQFTRQLEVSDELMHDLHVADHGLAELTANNRNSEHIFTPVNADLRDRAETYNNLFVELKNKYRSFLEKWM